ncbi:hypothetical protein IGI04_042691, partial [Brassica rapa subsp. trilocularis]
MPYTCGDSHWKDSNELLAAYTGAPSNRGNNDQEYLRKADLDALIKLFKENGNTFGYSFGARARENHKDLTRTDRMHESLIDMTSNLEHEGGNETRTPNREETSREESSGSHDQAVESDDQEEGAEE